MTGRPAQHPVPVGIGIPAGLTLIELLVAVVILAIVTAIAVPTYTQYVIRSNRADATQSLSQAAQELQRCHTLYGRFDHDECDIGLPITSENGHYQVTGSIERSRYTLTATPQGTQASRDDECGAFELDQAGIRAVSGSASAEQCW